MLMFIGRRLVIALPTIMLVSIYVFILQRLLPGDPILALAGDERDPAIPSVTAGSNGKALPSAKLTARGGR